MSLKCPHFICHGFSSTCSRRFIGKDEWKRPITIRRACQNERCNMVTNIVNITCEHFILNSTVCIWKYHLPWALHSQSGSCASKPRWRHHGFPTRLQDKKCSVYLVLVMKLRKQIWIPNRKCIIVEIILKWHHTQYKETNYF